MTTDREPEALPGGTPVDQRVGRLAPERATFARGDLVRKRSGSAWEGIVVGEYSTSLTPEGYAVESLYHPGSVQIYPAAALELVASSKTPNVGAKLETTAAPK